MRMEVALTRLVAALRGRDWHDDPVEREEFLDIIREEIGQKRATIVPLVALLDDPDWAVRAEAIDLLGELGNPQAVAPLIRVLHQSDARAAVYALRAIGTPEALAAIRVWDQQFIASLEAEGIHFPSWPDNDSGGHADS